MSTQENLWDEQGMAELVGLQLSEPSEDPDQEPVPTAVASDESLPSAPLLDPEDLADTSSVADHPKGILSLASNPFTKLGVVAAGTGLVIGFLAVFTNNIMDGEKPQPAKETQANFEDPMVEGTEDSATQDDWGKLLTDLAMGNQQAELEALSEESEESEISEISEPEPETTSEIPKFSSAPSPEPRPPQRVVERSTPTPAPRVSTPAAPRMASAPAPRDQPVAPESAVDPTEQWMALSHLGSYGRPPTNSSDAEAERESPLAPSENNTSSGPAQLVRAETSSPALAINHAEEAAILQEDANLIQEEPTTAPVLITGTQAAAVIVTPLIWAETTAVNGLQFVVQLTEPLLTPNEAVGLPIDTQLVVQVQSVDDSGLSQLTVVSLIQDGEEIPLPDNVIHLRGQDGTPLIAEKYGDQRAAMLRRNLNSALIAGVARAAELINTPKSSSVVTNAGGSTITQDNGDPNILAGILEGTFGELTDQMAERNQAALDAILERPTIWYLPPGTEIEVFINRTVML
ncbi:MAG: TrbI/VirB10 family protein [Cyanobacteria bacterium P01_B01_bin.77]